MRNEWSLYEKSTKSGRVWYARFWNPTSQSYDRSRSTGVMIVGKKGRRREAEKRAQEIYEELVVEDRNKKNRLLFPYLEKFWEDDGDYAKYAKGRDGGPLSKAYTYMNRLRTKKYITSYEPLQGLRVHELNVRLLEDWQLSMQTKGVGESAINDTFTSFRVAHRNLIRREEITNDPFSVVKPFSKNPKIKGILTESEITDLISVYESTPRIKLACLLACLAGMRMGEVRGLCWEDIDFDNKVINIRNNYVPLDGKKHLKGTKRKRPSRRARKVPLRSELLPGLNEVMGICPYEFSGEGYVLFNLNNPDIPLAKSSLQRGITRILSKIGISPEEKKKRNITFHSLRHNFITMAQKSGLSLIETSALAGHSTVIMTDYYTHAEQVVDMEETRLKLENGCKG